MSATFGMENNMTRKITAILAAGVVLTAAGVASAPARTNGHRQARQAPYSATMPWPTATPRL
jgi:hypothetical protein